MRPDTEEAVARAIFNAYFFQAGDSWEDERVSEHVRNVWRGVAKAAIRAFRKSEQSP